MTRFRLWLANLISGGEIARREGDFNHCIEEWAYWATLAEKRRDALMAIRDNTCCEGCQEAARVAREALE